MTRVPSRFCLCGFVAFALTACATVVDDADRLAQNGQHDQALSLLAQANVKDPKDPAVRAAWLRQRDLSIGQLANQADAQRASGRFDAARALLLRLQAIDPQHPRTLASAAELERATRHEAWMREAAQAQAQGRADEAEARVRQVLAEAPGHPAARALMIKLRERNKAPEAPRALGPAFQKPMTLDFRDAPLRGVLEGLGRSHGVNFVFDKDVRIDAKISIFLKDVTLDDALRVILNTQQLDRKLLNDSTLLIYANTQAKQREHQELVTRNFYLTNTDVKQAQNMVRTLAKTRDLFVDERLNLMVVRDTPEVIRLVERLIAGLDLPEPEVMLEVEVMEISSNRLDELGLQWPEQISYGLPSQLNFGLTTPVTEITRADRGSLRASISNPALVATLRESVTRGNTLANPRLRARNREKAKIMIGEKLPVFSATAATANVAGTTSVTYLDVGLKLEVEPTVQLDNDVIMKVNLEVSTLIGRVTGPAGSIGYQVGTRQATTSLRLRDGETQILAGLIKDEDSKGINGVPGLASLPLIGRLFGLHTDQRVKSEVVLLITPRVLRNIGLPDAEISSIPAGFDANPGAETLRLRSQAKLNLPPSGGAPAPAAASAATAQPGPAVAAAAATASALLVLSTSGQVEAGGTVAVTLQNRSSTALSGEVEYDANLLQSVQAAAGSSPGRLAFTLAAGGEQVFMLRAMDAAAGQSTEVSVVGTSATGADGGTPAVQVQGDGNITVLGR
jgi:general secretion pathway protein D